MRQKQLKALAHCAEQGVSVSKVLLSACQLFNDALLSFQSRLRAKDDQIDARCVVEIKHVASRDEEAH